MAEDGRHHMILFANYVANDRGFTFVKPLYCLCVRSSGVMERRVRPRALKMKCGPSVRWT
jgi:hypothetical protein